MATVDRVTAPSKLRLGPGDHGRRVSAKALDAAEYAPGFKYEQIDGRLYVSPQPNVPESLLERWLRRAIEKYADEHPEVIDFVATKGRVFLPAVPRVTVPEPDIAAYADFPYHLPFRKVRWQDVSPVLVCEVLVDGDIAKDMDRNPGLYLRVPSVVEYWVVNGAEDPDRPSLIQHRRRGKKWAVTTFPHQATFTTALLPGFSLAVDPRK